MNHKKLLLLAAAAFAFTQAQAAEKCVSCHDVVPDASAMTSGDIHARHVGISPQPEGNCLQCHEDQKNAGFTVPKFEACVGCHVDAADNPIHKTQKDFQKADCAMCHQPDAVRKSHLGKFEAAVEQGQMDIARIDVTDAHLIEKDGKSFAEVSFRILDAQGKPILVKTGNPADADWIKNLQLYINWGVSVDFLSPRGYSLFVKSNKMDITNKGTETTPAGERPRTPMARSKDGVYTYVLGPVTTKDAISGDRIDDLGVISDRFIYCFDENKELVSCDLKTHRKNTSWNHTWYFDKNGLVEAEKAEAVRPKIVGNAQCGTCHGYFEEHDLTNVECRNCHARKTAKNKKFADTTCFSGHDDVDGKHVVPFMEKPIAKRGLAGFGGSTKDLTLPCIVCHNANTPPTAAIRDRYVVAGQDRFIEDLILSSPDHKIWMHSLHSNTRPTARNEKGVRHVNYSAELSNCSRCHVGDSFAIDRLTAKGRPIALDTKYDSDSTVHPAVDFKVDLYASPVAAACFSCHAYTTDESGARVFNEKALNHMKMGGASFGVPLEDVKKEACASCHSKDNLKQVHKLK